MVRFQARGKNLLELRRRQEEQRALSTTPATAPPSTAAAAAAVAAAAPKRTSDSVLRRPPAAVMRPRAAQRASPRIVETLKRLKRAAAASFRRMDRSLEGDFVNVVPGAELPDPEAFPESPGAMRYIKSGPVHAKIGKQLRRELGLADDDLFDFVLVARENDDSKAQLQRFLDYRDSLPTEDQQVWRMVHDIRNKEDGAYDTNASRFEPLDPTASSAAGTNRFGPGSYFASHHLYNILGGFYDCDVDTGAVKVLSCLVIPGNFKHYQGGKDSSLTLDALPRVGNMTTSSPVVIACIPHKSAFFVQYEIHIYGLAMKATPLLPTATTKGPLLKAVAPSLVTALTPSLITAAPPLPTTAPHLFTGPQPLVPAAPPLPITGPHRLTGWSLVTAPPLLPAAPPLPTAPRRLEGPQPLGKGPPLVPAAPPHPITGPHRLVGWSLVTAPPLLPAAPPLPTAPHRLTGPQETLVTAPTPVPAVQPLPTAPHRLTVPPTLATAPTLVPAGQPLPTAPHRLTGPQPLVTAPPLVPAEQPLTTAPHHLTGPQPFVTAPPLVPAAPPLATAPLCLTGPQPLVTAAAAPPQKKKRRRKNDVARTEKNARKSTIIIHDSHDDDDEDVVCLFTVTHSHRRQRR